MSEETLNACTTVLKKNSYVLEWLAEQKYAHRASVQADTIENRVNMDTIIENRVNMDTIIVNRANMDTVIENRVNIDIILRTG